MPVIWTKTIFYLAFFLPLLKVTAADFQLILPVESHLHQAGEQLQVLVKLPSHGRCSSTSLRASVSNSNDLYSLQATDYPGEYVARLPLVDSGSFTFHIFDQQGRCSSSHRSIISQNYHSKQKMNDLLRSMGVGESHKASSLSHDWSDAMVILALAKIGKNNNEKEVHDFLHHFFDQIEKSGMKRIDHPDRAPVVMGNVLFNRKQTTRYDSSIEKFFNYIQKVPLNRLGLVDHMGQSYWKRIGTRLLFNILGDAHSVWADSMMMYVMPSLMLGKYYPEITVTPQVIDGNSNINIASQYSLYDFAKFQLERMIDVLYSEHSLFMHSYDYRRNAFRPRDRNTTWLRANGWAFATLAFSLDYLSEDDPLRKRIEVVLAQGLEKMYQLKSPHVGAWRTMLLADQNYKSLHCAHRNDFEMAGTALIAWATALALRHGVLDQKFEQKMQNVRRALQGFLSAKLNQQREIEYLTLNWTSGMTNAHRAICEYEIFYRANIPNRSYGLGPYLLFLHELTRE